VRYTALGTLEVWLVSRDTEHRWRPQFQLREPVRSSAVTDDDEERADAATVPDGSIERAAALIRGVFTAPTAGPSPAAPETLMALLEDALASGRHAWPTGVIRPLCDALLEVAGGRSATPRHEARFLNLLGFCLRPGFGATRDAARMTEARTIGLAELAFPRDVQCQAEWLVLWQRLAGGLTPGQQQDLYQRHAASVGLGGRAPSRKLHPQIERETWRLLASLEHLPAARRTALGDAILSRLARDPESTSLLWALARVGSRVPFYGPANTVVPPGPVVAWVKRLLDRRRLSEEAAVTVVLMAALSGDAARDLPDDVRQEAVRRLTAAGHPPALAARLLEVTAPTRANAQQLYGESLPEGLRLGSGAPRAAAR
jgi:DNA-K related protein